jgi:hypothetical protein
LSSAAHTKLERCSARTEMQQVSFEKAPVNFSEKLVVTFSLCVKNISVILNITI